MKKILFVMFSLNSGGAERALINLLSIIDKDRYEIDLLLFSKEGAFLKLVPEYVNIIETPTVLQYFYESHHCFSANRILAYGYKCMATLLSYAMDRRVYYMKDYRWLTFYNRFIPKLQSQYDVAVSFISSETMFYIQDKVEAKKKIVFVHNDYKGMEYPEIYEKKYFVEMDVIATISDTCADILCQVFPECCNKICSIPNLVSSDAIRQYAILEEPEEFVHESCIKLLSVGRLTEQKGFDMAIEAASLLKKHNRNFKWIIIGNGEKEEDLKKLALKKNVEDCMLFIGLKDNPYIYMKCADIIVQTSRWEGKSVVLDEAKIIGTPIVTTDYPTAKDQIKDGKEGILVEMTPNGIASGIERLIDNVALKENIHKYLISHEYGNSKEIGRYYSMFDN